MTYTLFAAPLFSAHPFKTGALGASFQGLYRWLVDGTPIGLKPMQQTCLRHSQPVPVQSLKAPQPATRRGAMRLRVVRVPESGQPRASVGRMVISGRMADVCAELDRLAAQDAAQETALH